MTSRHGAISGGDGRQELAEQRMLRRNDESSRLTAREQQLDFDFPGTRLLNGEFHR
jgi:hypothetical protein